MFLEIGRKRRIGLVVDHPLRDLDGLCLVAQLLTARGHECVLLPFYTQHFDLPNLDLDVIVLNYARPANLPLIRAAASRGTALAVLDTEGGLIPEEGPTSAEGIARFLRESGVDEELALYLFWGQALRDKVVTETRLDPQKAIVSGCPRFDLAWPPYRHSATSQRRVLINTNFPVVNSAHVEPGDVDAKALRSVGFSDTDITKLAQTVGCVMARMIETIAALAKARPQREFIVRPHPFERSEPYERAFTECRNVTIEREGSASDALAKSNCLLHVNCTTAIEASLCGVPPISLDFINEPGLVAMARLPSEISHPAASIEEALVLIDGSDMLGPGNSLDAIAPFFGPLDGKAASRVAKALAELPLPSSAADHSQSLRRKTTAATGALIGSSAVEGVRKRLSPSRAAKAFTREQVELRIHRFADLHQQTPAKVEQIRSALGLPIEALRLSPETSKTPAAADQISDISYV